MCASGFETYLNNVGLVGNRVVVVGMVVMTGHSLWLHISQARIQGGVVTGPPPMANI